MEHNDKNTNSDRTFKVSRIFRWPQPSRVVSIPNYSVDHFFLVLIVSPLMYVND